MLISGGSAISTLSLFFTILWCLKWFGYSVRITNAQTSSCCLIFSSVDGWAILTVSVLRLDNYMSTIKSLPALPQVIASWLFGQVVIHFARRIYECSCISVYSESTINMLHYLMGFTFYASVGMALVSLLLPTPRALPCKIQV